MMFFFSPKRLQTKSGETLMEVLIAIVILVVFLTSVLTIINRAVHMNDNIQARVQALSLAREGLEGVRNVRDTNWLRFSGDRRNKWLCLDTECDNKISNGNYTLDFENGTAKITFVNEDDIVSEGYRLYQATDESDSWWTHSSSDGASPSRFYRQMELSFAPVQCPSDNCPNKLIVQSKVAWTEGEKTESVVLETHLFDYYQRDEY